MFDLILRGPNNEQPERKLRRGRESVRMRSTRWRLVSRGQGQGVSSLFLKRRGRLGGGEREGAREDGCGGACAWHAFFLVWVGSLRLSGPFPGLASSHLSGSLERN